MLVSSVEQLLQMSPDSAPEAFTGILHSLSPHKYVNSGTSGAKSSMQRGTLLDTKNRNTKIEIVFYGHPPMEGDLVGQQIYGYAQHGQRGLTGLKRRQNEYPAGKFTEQIWVYDKAQIATEGEGEGSGGGNEQPASGQNQPPAKQQQQRQQSQPPAQEQQQKPGNTSQPRSGATPLSPEDAVKKARAMAMRYGNLHLLSLRASVFVMERLNEERKAAGKEIIEFTGEDVQSAAAIFTIQGLREGMHTNLPNEPLPMPAKKTS